MIVSTNANPPQGAALKPPPGAPQTVAEALGQIVWLLSQSPLHKKLKIEDLEWSFMPAILHEQFRVFRFGPLPGLENVDPKSFGPLGMTKEGLEQLPLGVAIWAKLSAEAEAKLTPPTTPADVKAKQDQLTRSELDARLAADGRGNGGHAHGRRCRGTGRAGFGRIRAGDSRRQRRQPFHDLRALAFQVFQHGHQGALLRADGDDALGIGDSHRFLLARQAFAQVAMRLQLLAEHMLQRGSQAESLLACGHRRP